MKLRGGYNIRITGRPAARVVSLPEPATLLLPQRSHRLRFNHALVKNGDRVRRGDVLAIDSAHFGLPLLAPLGGTVQLRAHRGHITLAELDTGGAEGISPQASAEGQNEHALDPQRQSLVALGAWSFLFDAHTDAIPDPRQPANAAIVTTARLEPFAGPRGNVLLGQSFDAFLRGLDLLASLVEGTVYVAVPRVRGELASRLRQALATRPNVKTIDIPLRYPMDHFNVLVRALGLAPQRGQTVWGLRTEGVLAIDRALTNGQPVLDRLVAFGGPGASEPVHLQTPLGYPLDALLEGRLKDSPQRVIDGGILNGETVADKQLGVGVETTGLTILPEPTRREMFGFVRTGLDRISYSNCFLSILRPRYAEPLTTAMRGEHRPCIGCGFCEEVCPVGIMPHWIHKLAYQDALEEINRNESHRCVGCGLCSYVCPSKIDLRQDILNANEAIRRDLHTEAPSETEEVVA